MTAPTTAPELLELKPAQITPHPDNPRHDLGDLTDLTASIKAQGIAEPLVVVPTEKVGAYRLLMGHRRLAAAKAVKLKALPAIVRHDLDGDEPHQIELMLVENLQRTELTPLDEAEAYQQLLAFPDYTHNSIAMAVGRSKATVTKRVGLTRLGAKTKDALRGGQIGLDEAEKMVVFATDPAVSAKLEKAIGTHNFRYALEEARGARERANKIAAAEAKLKKAKVRQLTQAEFDEHTDGLWIDDLDIAPADHVDCPGHAAMVNTSSWNAGNITYVCTDARARHPKCFEGDADEPGSRMTDEQHAEHVAYQQAREQEREQLTTAARVRRDHLYRVVTGDPDVTQVSALQLMRDEILDLDHDRRNLVHDVLGVKADSDPGTKAELTRELQAAVSRLTLEQLIVLRDVAAHAAEEMGLVRGREAFGFSYTYGSGKNGYTVSDSYKGWRARLVDVYGYHWTDVEQAFIDRRAAELDEELKRYRPVVDAHLPEPSDADTEEDDS